MTRGDDQSAPEEPDDSTSSASSGGDELLVAEPPIVHLELPDQPRLPADDEVAVAIDDVAVSPVGSAEVGETTSILLGEDLVGVATGELSASRRTVEAETAAALTDERLLDGKRGRRPPPEGRWPELVYRSTLHLVNLGDSPAVRERKATDRRIGRALDGGTRYVPVLTRKGGVGKTTITTLLGMALADVREDRVIAIDANPDRGTLAERVPKRTRSTVRDLVIHAPSIRDFTELSSHVSRDHTRLDVLASDTDPLLSEAFDEDGYNVVADIAARYYSIILTDCGTGIIHSVMRATLRRADQIVIVSGGSIDEARLASETLTWLEANGYGDLVASAIVALNTATPNTKLVKLDEIEEHFRTRVRAVVRIPYDPELAAGSIVRYSALQKFTRDSARELAALVVDGLVEAGTEAAVSR